MGNEFVAWSGRSAGYEPSGGDVRVVKFGTKFRRDNLVADPKRSSSAYRYNPVQGVGGPK